MLDHIVKKCLAKDADDRWQSARDLRGELQWVQQEPTQDATRAVTAVQMQSRARLTWAAAIAAAVFAGSGLTWLYRARPAEPPEMRLQIVTPDATTEFALSPDGRKLAFVANGRIWARALDIEAATPLTGTEGGVQPFWSPDSRSVGFFADGKLKRLDLAAGIVQVLTDYPTGNSAAAWNATGVILVGGRSLPVERVPAAGGSRQAVTTVGTGQVDHRYPQFLPDGDHFLFFANGTPEVRGLYIGSLESKDTRRVVDADGMGGFLPPDYVLFVRQQTLFAQRLDLQRIEPLGDAFPVTTRVQVGQGGRTAVSASPSGLLAYRAESADTTQLAWFDRAGKQLAAVGEPDADARDGAGIRLSPDARSVVLPRSVDGNQDIWFFDLARNVRRRFTVDPAVENFGAWSPDGHRLVFHSNRTGRNDLYLKSVAGDTPEIPLLGPSDSENKNPTDWSGDGRFILYESLSPKTGFDLWIVPVTEDRQPVPIVRTPFREEQGRFSPDSQWIVYTSDASGRDEIVLKRLSAVGRELQVSTSGGRSAKWRGDGREILYRAPDNRVMAVAVTLPSEGTNVQLGVPLPLFTPPASVWDITRDGQRFLMNVPTDQSSASAITVVVNWRPPNEAER
jgi:Tol biopolymer transport system component